MYQLVGKSVEEKKLTGKENLIELIGKFRQSTAIMKHPVLPTVMDEIGRNLANKQESRNKQICVMLEDTIYSYEKDSMYRAIDYLALESLCEEFGLRYDELDPELFNLERSITVKTDAGCKHPINIPLLAHADLVERAWECEAEKIRCDQYNHNYGGREHSIKIRSSVPPMTKAARDATIEAKAEFYRIYSDRLKQIGLRDWIVKRLDTSKLISPFELEVYWIPKSDDLQMDIKTIERIIDRDPFIVATIYGARCFLVADWEVKAEEPYKHYLQEYMIK